MAASAASRARLISELSRPRASSPRDEEYATATATSFDPARDAIHSTAQFDNLSSQLQPPAIDQQYAEQLHLPNDQPDEASEGSASMMSIEIGRGVKRGAKYQDDDISSNAPFNFGNGSLYEVTGTPPLRPKNAQRTHRDVGKKQESTRRATDTLNAQDRSHVSAGPKHRSLSAAISDVQRGSAVSRQRQTSVPTRFTSHASHQNANNNPTVESNQSFLLPENLPNLTELVSGTRKDGTPVLNRAAKSRSRFTSGSYKPSQRDHYPIESVPIPEEEKVIYTSLQLLKDRVEQLELDKVEAQQRAEEYEDHIATLRHQLAGAQKNPDSGIGSEDESQHNGWQPKQGSKLQAPLQALQAHLHRSERKLGLAEIAVTRMRGERDKLVEQIGKAYFDFEEVKAENETFQENILKMQEENEDLKVQVNALREENRLLNLSMAKTMASRTKNPIQPLNRDPRDLLNDKKESLVNDASDRRRSTGQLSKNLDLESRIAREVHKNRVSASKDKLTRGGRTAQTDGTGASRSRSKSQQRASGRDRGLIGPRRTTSAPVESIEGDTVESMYDLDFTGKRQQVPTHPGAEAKNITREEDSRDITLLSFLDPNEVAKLRKKLEEERRAGRLKSTRTTTQAKEDIQPSISGLPRKSSLKDITGALANVTVQSKIDNAALDDISRGTKNVRVQSPHTTEEPSQSSHQIDDAEFGLLSNISRRRRRALSADGDTSAFIIPDITLHNSQAAFNASKDLHVEHNSASCTACPQGKDTAIPNPVPVTDRTEYDPDMTSATIRPAETPSVALAKVLKQLQDEITHLKVKLAILHARYSRHDPALSKRKREDIKSQIDRLTDEIEKRSNQVYALYDVLEDQKETMRRTTVNNDSTGKQNKAMTNEDITDTLHSIGMDAAEISGRVGRSAPIGLDGVVDLSEDSDELPWEGLSDVGGSDYDY